MPCGRDDKTSDFQSLGRQRRGCAGQIPHARRRRDVEGCIPPNNWSTAASLRSRRRPCGAGRNIAPLPQLFWRALTMHELSIPADLVQRVTERAGRAHPFDVIEPAKTAFVVVDMQNYFMKPGFQGEVPKARA